MVNIFELDPRFVIDSVGQLCGSSVHMSHR